MNKVDVDYMMYFLIALAMLYPPEAYGEVCSFRAAAVDLMGNEIKLDSAKLIFTDMEGGRSEFVDLTGPRALVARCGIYSATLQLDRDRSESERIDLRDGETIRFELAAKIKSEENNPRVVVFPSKLGAKEDKSESWKLISIFGQRMYEGHILPDSSIVFDFVYPGNYCLIRIAKSRVIWSYCFVVYDAEGEFALRAGEAESVSIRFEPHY